MSEDSFQSKCLSYLKAQLLSLGYDVDFKYTEGDGSYLSDNWHTLFTHDNRKIELFIYENQVGFFCSEEWYDFEIWDYKTTEDLFAAVVEALKECFSS